MLEITEAPSGPLSLAHARALVPRAAAAEVSVLATAHELVDDVRLHGEKALRAQADRFDGGSPASLRISPEQLERAANELDPDLRASIDIAIERVRLASIAQVPHPAITEVAPGAVIEQHWVPVERVGLYVPGGKAVYPSSVIMNVIAAQVAGVRSIALVSPPQRDHDKSIHPTIAAVAHIVGVDEVYAMGGAGAIGALAYGVPEIDLEPVAVITGPGNASRCRR